MSRAEARHLASIGKDTRPAFDSGLNPWRVTLSKNAAWQKLERRLTNYTKNFTAEWADYEANEISKNHLEFAKALCPKDTGKLANSLHITVDRTIWHTTLTSLVPGLGFMANYRFRSGDQSRAGGSVSVGSGFTGGSVASDTFQSGVTIIKARYYLTTDDPIAWHVEYGTSKMPARPFMRPAYAFAKALYIARVRMWAILRTRAGV